MGLGEGACIGTCAVRSSAHPGMPLGPHWLGLHPDTLKVHWGNSLVVQWLRLGTFTAGALVQSLVGELRSHKLHGVAEKKKKVHWDMRMAQSSSRFSCCPGECLSGCCCIRVNVQRLMNEGETELPTLTRQGLGPSESPGGRTGGRTEQRIR